MVNNIPLNSKINTTDTNNLMSNEPSFDNKNSLLYQGISSNMTENKGSGILSTTSKNIRIDGRTLYAGSQTFNVIPDDYFYTVRDVGSHPIGENEVAIENIIAGASGNNFYINEDGRISRQYFGTTTFSQSYAAPVFNAREFVFVGINANVIEIWFWGSHGNETFRFYASLSSQGLDFGKTITACRMGDYVAIGFDDEDYRKRWLLHLYYPDAPFEPNIKAYAGFGCISAKGEVTGEPVPILLNDPKRAAINLVGSGSGGYCGPIFTRSSSYDTRYKVLDNGAISFWTGFFDPNATSTTVSPGRKYIDIIADENAGLLASPTDGSTRQGGIDNWHWKLHNTRGYRDGLQVNGQEMNEPFRNIYGSTQAAPVFGALYYYGATTNEENWYRPGNRMAWLYGLKFDNESVTQMTMPLDEVINAHGVIQDVCCSSLKVVNIMGDWTYGYDSMKSAAELTDFDGVFPYLRLFFNVVGNKGKYWDYGTGWSRCYHYAFTWGLYNNEVMASHNPLSIFEYYEGCKWSDQWQTPINSSADSLSVWAEKCAANFAENEHVIEPLGKTHFNTVGSVDYSWRYVPSNETYYSNVMSASGLPMIASETEWFGSGRTTIRRVKIKGSGQGLAEEVFNFGGLGDATILNSFARTINIQPDKQQIGAQSYTGWDYDSINNNELRLGIYQGINTTLSYAGTLLFSASEDLASKYHVYKDGGWLYVTIFDNGMAQWLTIVRNTSVASGTITIDKLTDYMFRLNVLGGNNILMESRDGIFSLVSGFNSFIGEMTPFVADLSMSCPSSDVSSNNSLIFGCGVNANLLENDPMPSFLMPAVSIDSYVSTLDMKYFENTVLKNRHGFIKNKLKDSNVKYGVETYYTSLLSSADVSYKETDKISGNGGGSFIGLTGVQSFETKYDGFTYWIDAKTVIHPVAIGSKVSGINYHTSTIELTGNNVARFYSQNNKTWPVYNYNAKVYFGNNIFTIMGSNYYFDGQGVYYLGDSRTGGATGQYSENILIAYAIGMEYLCNAPSEAYFYSNFDRCLYIFTSSNTMQKSTSLSRFGAILDSCYCPVNQALYILFDGKLFIKTQDDNVLLDVEGTQLQTTSSGVQVVGRNRYVIHSPYLYDDTVDLNIETEWLGTPDTMNKYQWVDIVLKKMTDNDITLNADLQTIAGTDVSSNVREFNIKKTEWNNNGFYRLRITPNEPVGNAFKVILKSKDKVGVSSIAVYREQASDRNSAKGWM